ncbi:cysteine hydrolase [bacterium]|nr:cysteine hydrolase [bacterium]
MTNKVLIVIDMQNDFVTGTLGSPAAQAIIPAIKAEIQKYLDNDGQVIYTRDTHNTDYLNTPEGKKLPVPHCIRGTDGWMIVPELDDVDNRLIINKPTFGFNAWDAVDGLEDAEIKLCGVCTDICVVSNALIMKAVLPNAEISIDPKLCAGTSVDAHNAAITVMRSCQINIIE